MKIEQAKAIPLEHFLANLGFQPARSQANQLWYLSPLRQEKTPSFKVNTDLNLWFDFGAGQGGTIIDLAMAFDKDASVPAALRLVESTMQGKMPQLERAPPSPRKAPASHVELNYSCSLKNLGLKRYLAQRGIPSRKYAREICEVHYSTNGQEYIAIGFPSDRGGYEIRNRSFKGSLGPKSISTRSGEDSTSAIMFEGFFDYLTYLTLWGRPSSQIVVLNSVAMQEQGVEHLRKQNIARLELFRDNDPAGVALLTYLQKQLPEIPIVDQAAAIYPGTKDLNEWHLANRAHRGVG